MVWVCQSLFPSDPDVFVCNAFGHLNVTNTGRVPFVECWYGCYILLVYLTKWAYYVNILKYTVMLCHCPCDDSVEEGTCHFLLSNVLFQKAWVLCESVNHIMVWSIQYKHTSEGLLWWICLPHTHANFSFITSPPLPQKSIWIHMNIPTFTHTPLYWHNPNIRIWISLHVYLDGYIGMEWNISYEILNILYLWTNITTGSFCIQRVPSWRVIQDYYYEV